MGEETVNGRQISEEQIQEWADEAEGGYDVETLRKRGRPTIGDGPSTVIPVRMDAALLKALNELADERHLSRSEAIREAVRSWTGTA